MALAGFLITLPRYTELGKTFYILLLLCASGYLLVNIRRLGKTTGAERLFFGVVILNFLWIAFCYYFNGEPADGHSFLWGRHFYFLFMIALFFLFRGLRISMHFVLLVVVFSLCLSFVDIIIGISQGLDYRFKGMNPNAFAPIQLVLTAIALIYFYINPADPRRWLALAAAGLGIAAIVFSKSKNSWLTLVILGLLSVFYLTRSRPTGQRIGAFAGIMLVMSSFYLLPPVQSRIDIGLANIYAFFEEEDPQATERLGTFGTRMQLWKVGWFAFTQSPLTGIGVGGLKPLAQNNLQTIGVHHSILRHAKYVHNQYLAALATRGLPGVALVLLLLCVPIYIAASHRVHDRDDEWARLALIILCLAYLIGNIFEDHLETKPAIMFITVLIPYFLAILSRSQDSPTTEQPP